MIKMDELHEQAMDLSDQAYIAKQRGNAEAAAELFRRAFELEEKAAGIVENNLSAEPTRSVLYRSAAAMAIDAGALDEARQLIGKALSGHPPREIEQELLELLETMRFARHLEVKDVALQSGELQFSITGNEVGPGITQTDVFIDRVKYFEKLVFRTVERKLGISFRKQGSPRSSLVKGFSLYLIAPRAGSFAVTLRLGQQMHLPIPELDLSNQVIGELLEGITLVNEAREEKLQELIPDETYRENFVALVRQIAPDGDKVKMVGLTAESNGQEVQVAVTRSRQDIPLVPGYGSTRDTTKTELQPEEFTGRLLLADATKGTGKIRLIADDGSKYEIKVSEGIADIVRSMYDEIVTVSGVRKGKSIYLRDIHPV